MKKKQCFRIFSNFFNYFELIWINSNRIEFKFKIRWFFTEKNYFLPFFLPFVKQGHFTFFERQCGQNTSFGTVWGHFTWPFFTTFDWFWYQLVPFGTDWGQFTVTNVEITSTVFIKVWELGYASSIQAEWLYSLRLCLMIISALIKQHEYWPHVESTSSSSPSSSRTQCMFNQHSR